MNIESERTGHGAKPGELIAASNFVRFSPEFLSMACRELIATSLAAYRVDWRC
jgi:hypothetical protein